MEALDLHCELIMDEYREALPVFEAMRKEVLAVLRDALERNGLVVTAVEARVKTEESLAGKLALKGAKYATLSDITDILGARIITFYTDDVDRIAAMAEHRRSRSHRMAAAAQARHARLHHPFDRRSKRRTHHRLRSARPCRTRDAVGHRSVSGRSRRHCRPRRRRSKARWLLCACGR